MIFVDTGAILGRYLLNDQYHSSALWTWSELTQSRERFFTSNFVLDEAFTSLARNAGHGFAADKARRIYASGAFSILRPFEEQELQALNFFEKFADQKIGFTDCVSFALMRSHKIQKVFTFDRHFRFAGFTCIP